jgi:cytochrome P450
MAVALRPPGPKGTWLAGNLPDFRRDRLDFLLRCAREFGDFVSLRFGPRRIILLSHPEAIEEVLVTQNANFIKHFALRFNPLVLGNGLLTSEGNFWLRQRRLIQPVFSKQRIASYAEVMVDYTRRMLDQWQPGQDVDVLAEMTQLTLAIAAKVMFDADVEGEARDVGTALTVAMECFTHRFNATIPIPSSWPTPRNFRFWKAVRTLDKIIYRFIDQRRGRGADRHDLLSLLLQAREENGGRMTDKQLRDEAMTLFLAGHETTALTLAWTWYALASHPEEEAKLAAEVHSVLGDRPPSVVDLPRLRHVERVVLESMRLYPPAYMFGREARADCLIGDYPVPRGMTILMSQWVVHRDPRFWVRPDEFLPDRWIDGPAGLPKYAYFPFGGGPRQCIGNTFALLETSLVLAAIAQRYRFTVAKGQKVVPWPTFTLRPQNEIKAVLERRSQMP